MTSRPEPSLRPAPIAVIAAGVVVGLLAGCPRNPNVPNPSATFTPSGGGSTDVATPGPSSPSDSPASPLDGAYSDPGYAVYGGSVVVDVKTNGAAQANALVKLYGPTLAVATTGAAGRVTFGPLIPGTDYRLVVEAAGLATATSAPFAVVVDQKGSQRLDLKVGGRVTGTVTADGAPVPGAVVSDGTNSALTDDQGRYELKGVVPGAVTLTASRSRWKVAQAQATAAADKAVTSDFKLTKGAASLYFDVQVPSGIPATRLTAVKQSLGQAGWTLVDQPPSTDGVWVLVSPARDIPADQRERMTTFVAQGGKLVVLGDWGGFGGFRTPAANALLHRLGLHFNADLVREPGPDNPEWLAVTRFEPSNPAVADLGSLALYQGCSTFGLAPMAKIAQTGDGAYRVQAGPVAASQIVALGGPYKGGKAIVVGDATAFTDDDADGDGTANAAEAQNLRFAERLMAW